MGPDRTVTPGPNQTVRARGVGFAVLVGAPLAAGGDAWAHPGLRVCAHTCVVCGEMPEHHMLVQLAARAHPSESLTQTAR